jgi:hypothetical protein
MLPVVLAALLLAGCATPTTGRCERALYFSKGMVTTEEYARALRETFELSSTGKPTRNVFVWDRLSGLERYCWQMRIR